VLNQVLGPAHRIRRIDREDLPDNDQSNSMRILKMVDILASPCNAVLTVTKASKEAFHI